MNESQVTDSHDIVTDIARIEPQAQKPKSREKNRGCHWKSLRNTKYKLPKRILTTCYFGRSEGLFFFFWGASFLASFWRSRTVVLTRKAVRFWYSKCFEMLPSPTFWLWRKSVSIQNLDGVETILPPKRGVLAKSRLQRGGDFFLLTLVIWHHVGYSRSSKSDAANLGRRLEGFIKTWFLEVGERLEGLEVSMEFIKLIRLWTYNFRRKTVKDPQIPIFYLNFVRVKWWKFRSASISMGLVSTHVKIRKARLWFLHFRGLCKSFFPSELECRYIDTCIQV